MMNAENKRFAEKEIIAFLLICNIIMVLFPLKATV